MFVLFQANPSGNSIYVVKYTFSAEAPTELSVNKNDIVRVLQFHDAFGHNEWWKVEHNGKIGFVPSSFLAPYDSIVMASLTRNTSIAGKAGQTGSLRSGQTSTAPSRDQINMVPNTVQSHMVMKSGQTGNGSLVNMPDHVVKYDFEPHGPSELGVVTGELVRVVKQCDSSGSNEWWLVESRGTQGYVPASYLVKKE